MENHVIVSSDIKKSFGDKVALNGISFTIDKGEIFGFLGPSGAGKTTMINILTGQLTCDRGYTELLGKRSTYLTPNELKNIGIVSDKSGFYEKLTLYKNLLFYVKLYGTEKDKLDDILKELRLYDSRNIVAEKLSTGMKQRMLLVRALINSPKILFLDEPTSGLDPTTAKVVHELLFKLKSEGITIFLTTHNMAEADLLCDKLALLNKGKLIEQGSPKDIIYKYNTYKKVKVLYENNCVKEYSFDDLNHIDLTDAVTIHSCEPTLEEIFIRLTGDKLDV